MSENVYIKVSTIHHAELCHADYGFIMNDEKTTGIDDVVPEEATGQGEPRAFFGRKGTFKFTVEFIPDEAI